jgi:hypothetical protein
MLIQGLRNKWEDNIKIILKIMCDNVDWIHLAHDTVQKWYILKMVIHLRVT